MAPPMKAEPGRVVTLTYDITNEKGEVIESSDLSGAVSFLVGTGSIIKGLDKRVAGMSEGDEADFQIPPEEAFGKIEDAPRRKIARTEFPADTKIDKGLKFEAGLPGGGGQTITLEGVEIEGETLEVRMLHPLCGQTIGMSGKIIGVREATAAEKETGKIVSKPPPPPPKK